MSRTSNTTIIEAARKLWDAGLSASEIGLRLGVTKNSIIGIAGRNGFASRKAPPKKVGQKPTAPRAARRRHETLLAAQLRSHAGLVARTAAPAVRMPEVHIGAARTCQSPQWGDDEKPTHCYCDAPATVGSYCAAHHRDYYVQFSPRDLDAGPLVSGWGAGA